MAQRARATLDYALAAGFAVVALAARASLQPFLGPMQPFAHGFVAVAAAVLFFGWRPAMLTAAIAYSGGTYFFLHPDAPVEWSRRQDTAALLIYATSAGLIIFMGHRARRAEQRLAAANEMLRLADRRKDEFLAMLSHELRNPVGVIGTAVSILESAERDPELRETIAIIGRQSRHIRRLVDDLLDVGRISRGRLTLQRAAIDLRSCVQDAADTHGGPAARKGQTLRLSLPSRPVVASVDHARLVQVVSNLIDNASKYSTADADIHVSLAELPNGVRIEVADNGPGIPDELLPAIFDLFDQGKSTTSGGLGMGLGLCKRLVEMHGGTIAASNRPEGGAVFVVSLPCGGRAPGDTPAPSQSSPSRLPA